jgi:starch synthase (maltosyl-transferring)
MHVEDGRRRVVIEGVAPQVDCGRFPAKRVVGDQVTVQADAFTDGHDAISCRLLYRRAETPAWSETRMEPLINDRWQASFPVTGLGRYCYTVEAWVDHFKTWAHDLEKRIAAGQDVRVDLEIGAALVEAAAGRATAEDAAVLRRDAAVLRAGGEEAILRATSPELLLLMERHPDRRFATTYRQELEVVVDPELARFGAWYEFFPRSCVAGGEGHGTFRGAERRLPEIAAMGFDIVYLPPIHPIGRTFRKGRNNTLNPAPHEPGSPWAIGGEEGGHKSVHPDLGTLEDFRHFVSAARGHRLEVALDIAFQASPDHPYVREHPAWFKHRPDGTIQYAENPPKKYQDIYPFDFESEQWRELWEELKSVFTFWIEQGVRVFRVDNPHTKPFPMWEWIIAEVKRKHPETIFLSEAFTRPKVMYELAKLGFSQSYTYFAWRNARWEIEQYLRELTQTDVKEFFRPNFWPNTPDILTEYLQVGGRPAFMARFVLAATLAASYGIYGPAFETCENRAREFGSEEYFDSEKYQVRRWPADGPNSLVELITRVNRIRRENPALQTNDRLHFHGVDNDMLITYSKTTADWSNTILVVVNLDPHHTQSGWLTLDLHQLGVAHEGSFQVHDLLTNGYYLWSGAHNFVQVNPQTVPAHVFRVRRRIRTERDFEYFL